MQQGPLFAPWRIDYLRSLDKPAGDACFLCQAALVENDAQRQAALVLWTTPHSVVLMNRYPYCNGHLLISPRAHKADLHELTDAEHLDLARQTVNATRLLSTAVSAQGFNIGVNIGRVAGAGMPGHVHQHVVPRWGGDTNFFHVIGETRLVPQAISQLYRELRQMAIDLKFEI